MSSYQVEFFNSIKRHISDLNDKLTTDDEGNLTHSFVNTCYWANVLFQAYSDMEDIAGMMAMAVSCDFNPMREREQFLREAHDKELREAVETVAQRLNQSK